MTQLTLTTEAGDAGSEKLGDAEDLGQIGALGNEGGLYGLWKAIQPVYLLLGRRDIGAVA
jgi:hypothetical protein